MGQSFRQRIIDAMLSRTEAIARGDEREATNALAEADIAARALVQQLRSKFMRPKE